MPTQVKNAKLIYLTNDELRALQPRLEADEELRFGCDAEDILENHSRGYRWDGPIWPLAEVLTDGTVLLQSRHGSNCPREDQLVVRRCYVLEVA